MKSESKYSLIDKYDRYENHELFEQFRFIKALLTLYICFVLALFTASVVFMMVLLGLMESSYWLSLAARLFLGAFTVICLSPLLKILFRHYIKSFTQIYRRNEPEIFTIVDEVRDKAGLEGEYKLYLNADVNAYASTVRKYVFFGKKIPAISLGILLLKHLSRKELQSIVAHEIGHIKLKHTDLLSARTLISIAVSCPFHESRIMQKLLNELSALLFCISKRQELEADEIEYELCDPIDIKNMMTKMWTLSSCESEAYRKNKNLFYKMKKTSNFIKFILDDISAAFEHENTTANSAIGYYRSDFYDSYHPSYETRLKRIDLQTDFKLPQFYGESLISPEKYDAFCDAVNKKELKTFNAFVNACPKLEKRLYKLSTKKKLSQSEHWELYEFACELNWPQQEEILNAYMKKYEDSKLLYHMAEKEFDNGDFEKCIDTLMHLQSKYKKLYPRELYLLQLAYRCAGNKNFAYRISQYCREQEVETGFNYRGELISA